MTTNGDILTIHAVLSAEGIKEAWDVVAFGTVVANAAINTNVNRVDVTISVTRLTNTTASYEATIIPHTTAGAGGVVSGMKMVKPTGITLLNFTTTYAVSVRGISENIAGIVCEELQVKYSHKI